MEESTDLDSMTQIANDLGDLENLFDFRDMDLNTIPETAEFGGQIQQDQHGTHPNTPFQDMSEMEAMAGTTAHDFGGHNQFSAQQSMEQQQQHHYRQQREKTAPTSNPYNVDPIYQASVQQAMYHQAQPYQILHQNGFPIHQHVPPTPNSFDMHGESGRFMQHSHSYTDAHQRAIMEQHYGLRKDDVIAMTPTSPAGTPQFNQLPEFTTPGAYFSPLTSPMLHAQIQQQTLMHSQSGYITNPSTAPSSITNSPIDPNMDIDMLDDNIPLPGSTGPQPRRTRRQVATPRTVTAGTRGQRKAPPRTSKRKSASQNAPSGSDEGAGQQGFTSIPSSAHLQTPGQPSSSEGGSISPEPLSESVMGPPPRPGSRSVQASPNIIPHQQSNAPGPAATPKSILTSRSSHHVMNGHRSSDQSPSEPARLDDLALPEAARQIRGRPSLTQINTGVPLPEGEDDTPRLSARKTPKLGPASTPSSARPSSALDSPAAGSPMTASTPSAILNKGGRNGKKRGSMSASNSKLVSPALVPKISPSIKPLLPEGTPLNSAQQAMLLASKSNYQNLVEGNRLPGVNYPDSLSTGLTSKRTSHKVAEQGRRNRINEALKEMQALIPKPAKLSRSPTKDEDPDLAIAASPEAGDENENADVNGTTNCKESKEDAISKSNSSKAATVELANEYIKKMQKDSAVQFAEVEKLKRENEELKRRLAGNSQASSDAGVGAEERAPQSPDKMSEDGASTAAGA